MTLDDTIRGRRLRARETPARSAACASHYRPGRGRCSRTDVSSGRRRRCPS